MGYDQDDVNTSYVSGRNRTTVVGNTYRPALGQHGSDTTDDDSGVFYYEEEEEEEEEEEIQTTSDDEVGWGRPYFSGTPSWTLETVVEESGEE